MVRSEMATVADPVIRRQQARHYVGVRRQGDDVMGVRATEAHAGPREPVDPGRHGACMTVRAKRIRAERVHRDQQHVQRMRRLRFADGSGTSDNEYGGKDREPPAPGGLIKRP